MYDVLDVATAAAREAGTMLLSRFQGMLAVESKADGSLVTDADRESERIIIEKIRATFPGHGIVGEESVSSRDDADYVWVIDPLDGTHNFIRGIADFGVSIGVRHNGTYCCGVIYMPVEDALYRAERGAGAFKDSRRIRVSTRVKLAACSVGCDSGLRKGATAKAAVIGALGTHAFNIRLLGSSVRMLTYVAEGKLDALIEFEDKVWDCAAGIAIVEEAGGKVSTFSGDPVPFATSDYVASNGIVHQELSRLLRENYNRG